MNKLIRQQMCLRVFHIVFYGLVCGLISACQNAWYPEVDFGSSVNQAISDQVANKNAPSMASKEFQGMDGPVAKSSIDSYQKSFEAYTLPSMYGGTSGSFVNSMGSSGSSSMPSITGR